MQWDSHTQAGNERSDRNTLFLQNWTGALKVRVTIASFPVVVAPPAAGVPETISPAVEEGRRIRSSQQTGRGVRVGGRGDDKTGQGIRHPPKVKSDKVMGKEKRK